MIDLKDGECLRISVRVGFVRILFMRNHGTPNVRYEMNLIGLDDWQRRCKKIGVIGLITERVNALRQLDHSRDKGNN
jgi:hypothetical protein